MEKLTMEQISNYCKHYGFIYPGSEIYDGFANTWDFGPLGSRMLNNIKDCWRKRFIQQREGSYEIDCGIIMNPKVWEASGHLMIHKLIVRNVKKDIEQIILYHILQKKLIQI